MKTIPFDENKVKHGDIVCIQLGSFPPYKFLAMSIDTGFLACEDRLGSVNKWTVGVTSLIDNTPPALEPYTMETFPADGWFVMSGCSNRSKWKVLEVSENNVVYCSGRGDIRDILSLTFSDVLEHWEQLMPDGTTRPCGIETKQ